MAAQRGHLKFFPQHCIICFVPCQALNSLESYCQANNRPVKLPLPVAVSSPAAWPSNSSASVALWRRACCSGIPGSNRHSVAPPPQPNCSSAVWFPCPTCPCSGATLGEKFPLRNIPFLRRAKFVERNLKTNFNAQIQTLLDLGSQRLVMAKIIGQQR